jgi:hypothetical protein
MALSINKGALNKLDVAATAEDKAVKEAAQAAAAEKVDNDILFSKSDTLTLIATLGDPSKPDVTNREIDGKMVAKTDPTIVGYQFVCSEDLEVPECGLGDDAKTNPMSYQNLTGTRKVKAGEPFNLTRMETGLLLSQPQYNARISGGGKAYTVAYQKSNRGSAGSEASKAMAQPLPTVSLRGITVSVKEIPCKHVLSFDTEERVVKDASGKERTVKARINKKVMPGFEKFEPLCRQAPRKPANGEAAAPANTRNTSAQAFLAAIARQQRG